MRRALGWAAVVGLLLLPSGAGGPRLRGTRTLSARLLGPLSPLAAEVQWVRVNDAIRSGRDALVLARGETALDLAPEATEGWLYLGHHLAFTRASVEREDDPARRLAWVRAGLELAERGEALADDPGALAVWGGLVRVKEAEEGDLPWPGGRAALLAEALAAFERGAGLGHPEAEALAAGVRRRLGP